MRLLNNRSIVTSLKVHQVAETKFVASLKATTMISKFALRNKLEGNNDGTAICSNEICNNFESNNGIWKKLESSKLDGGGNNMLEAWKSELLFIGSCPVVLLKSNAYNGNIDLDGNDNKSERETSDNIDS